MSIESPPFKGVIQSHLDGKQTKCFICKNFFYGNCQCENVLYVLHLEKGDK